MHHGASQVASDMPPVCVTKDGVIATATHFLNPVFTVELEFADYG